MLWPLPLVISTSRVAILQKIMKSNTQLELSRSALTDNRLTTIKTWNQLELSEQQHFTACLHKLHHRYASTFKLINFRTSFVVKTSFLIHCSCSFHNSNLSTCSEILWMMTKIFMFIISWDFWNLFQSDFELKCFGSLTMKSFKQFWISNKKETLSSDTLSRAFLDSRLKADNQLRSSKGDQLKTW